jgi:hypothetical protein
MINTIYSSFDNYGIQIYRRFIGSLLDTGFSGRINILMMDDNSIDIAKTLYDEFQYEFINFVIIEEEENITKPNIHRYIHINDCLGPPNLESYGFSLICDSQDVLFQSNPQNLKLNTDYDLYVYEEGVSFRDGFNAKSADYMNSIYGDVDYRDQYVLCIGALIVQSISLKKFLSHFAETIQTLNLENIAMDQGLLNYLFYKNKLPITAKSIPNINDVIYHAGMGLDQCVYKDGKIMLESTQKIPMLIHQFDRRDKIPQHMLEKLSTKYDFIR